MIVLLCLIFAPRSCGHRRAVWDGPDSGWRFRCEQLFPRVPDCSHAPTLIGQGGKCSRVSPQRSGPQRSVWRFLDLFAKMETNYPSR